MTEAHHHHSHEHGPHEHGCAHAAERRDGASDAMARAEAVCRSRGVRLTPIRREVLEALYATHRPLGAYDIAETLGSARRLAPITIYRALDFLIEQGFVHRLASRNAFVACPHGHGPGDLVAFLICERCGGVDELSNPRLSGAITALLREEGFEPHLQVLEIAGACAHCRVPDPEPLPQDPSIP